MSKHGDETDEYAAWLQDQMNKKNKEDKPEPPPVPNPAPDWG